MGVFPVLLDRQEIGLAELIVRRLPVELALTEPEHRKQLEHPQRRHKIFGSVGEGDVQFGVVRDSPVLCHRQHQAAQLLPERNRRDDPCAQHHPRHLQYGKEMP